MLSDDEQITIVQRAKVTVSPDRIVSGRLRLPEGTRIVSSRVTELGLVEFIVEHESLPQVVARPATETIPTLEEVRVQREETIEEVFPGVKATKFRYYYAP